LSRHLSFPGRFLVFMPGIDHIGISRKITDPEERDRLRELIRSHAQPGEGFIVRTAAIGEKDEDLVGDVAFLRQTVLPLAQKSAAALQAWLGEMWPQAGAARVALDLEAVPGLAAERDALWARLEGASFLDLDEKRRMAGLEERA
ncbi:MAG: ribonuclease E/G, partial [Hyphomonadaceae bacterium]|nr:ribonuclease E/G [Hyphomonadaceae bacterium]